jgi:hypothetical protein
MKKLRILTRLLLITSLFSAAFLLGQTTVGTGSIVGTVIDVMFAFLPSDVVTQILNCGLPAPIDIQVIGNNLEGNRAWASQLLEKVRYVPGTADLRLQQPFDEPYLHFRVERTKAQELGFSADDIAQNLLVSLSGSFQTSSGVRMASAVLLIQALGGGWDRSSLPTRSECCRKLISSGD